jgi:hypothetical protein
MDRAKPVAMNPSFPFTSEYLRGVFPELPLPPIIHDESSINAEWETEPLEGLRWSEVTMDVLHDNFGVAFFLCPGGLRYYVPSFMLASRWESNYMDLALDYLLAQFNTNGDVESTERCRARWSELDGKQWDCLTRWVEWLQKEVGEDRLPDVRAAWEVTQSGEWRSRP